MLNLGTVRLDHRFNDIFSLRNTLRFSHNDREHEVTAPRFNAATPGFFNRNRPKRDLAETILTNQTDLTAKFDTLGLQHTLVTGVEFSRETLDQRPSAIMISADAPNQLCFHRCSPSERC